MKRIIQHLNSRFAAFALGGVLVLAGTAATSTQKSKAAASQLRRWTSAG